MAHRHLTMTEWLPVVVGFGCIGAIVAVRFLLPRSRLSRELWRPIGLQVTGTHGTLARRDYFRAASVFGILVGPALLGLAYAIFALMRGFPEQSRTGLLAQGLAFMLVVLGALSIA